MMIEKLSFRKFELSLESVEDLLVPPYKGAMFRGAFGMAFRRSVCATGLPECHGCQLKNNCIYFSYFETEMPVEGIHFLEGPQKVPHPFVLHPPASSAVVFPAGYRFKVGVTLIGNAVVNLPYFVHTFRKLASEGLGKGKRKAELLFVEDITSPERIEIYNSKEGRIKPGHPAVTVSELISVIPDHVKRISLDFNTPLRMQHHGKVLQKKEEIDIRKLVSLARRRLMALSYLYCDAAPEKEPRHTGGEITIVSNTMNFFDWERFSNRHHKKINMGGFLGKMVLEGELNDIAPVLLAGSYLNIGKNTLFGLGQYTIKFN